MKREDAFPSKFLKAGDVGDEGLIVTITDVTEEEMKTDSGEKELKLFVYFKEFEKALILNKTNGNTLFDLCGEDTDDWAGKRVKLVTGMTTFQGKAMECIRVSTKAVPGRKPAAAPAPAPIPEPVTTAVEAEAETEEEEDEIPF